MIYEKLRRKDAPRSMKSSKRQNALNHTSPYRQHNGIFRFSSSKHLTGIILREYVWPTTPCSIIPSAQVAESQREAARTLSFLPLREENNIETTQKQMRLISLTPHTSVENTFLLPIRDALMVCGNSTTCLERTQRVTHVKRNHHTR